MWNETSLPDLVITMKRYNNLYQKVCSFENLFDAWKKACRANPNKPETIKFGYNLEYNLLTLQNELIKKEYLPGDYRRFTVYDPKMRLIWSAPFRDRVVHHAICNVIEPLFNRTFIYDSYACRKGKGIHNAIMQLSRFLQNPQNRYCLKCDVSKYFNNVDHKILLSMIERKIKDGNVLWLVEIIVKSIGRNKGIPIGNLTSQLFANIYLNKLDYFVKHSLKARYYIRYVDDFVILAEDSKKLENYKRVIRNFLEDELKLELHPKKAVIFPAKNGIDFLGFRVYKTHRKVRKSSVLRFKREFKKIRTKFLGNAINMDYVRSWFASYLGHWQWADTYRLRKKITHTSFS